mmetsp:Transcript_25062/g.70661  ORF Transcript_25062/g.70661 Transcript_25062/m.70661 type:complete len:447 (-) Transcript_25062:195-1535(-)
MADIPPRDEPYRCGCGTLVSLSCRGLRLVGKADLMQAFRTSSAHCEDLNLNPQFPIININLHKDPCRSDNLRLYYQICRGSQNLHVTTSCFTVWKQNKRVNGYGKVVPAVLAETEDPVRIFFFDDNIEWGGAEDSPGICNLRDLNTGVFVDFGEGRNGFTRDYAGLHTVIHHSSKYRNILIKANILDAFEDADYFTKIIQRYAQPKEKILVYMDVNSTIMCNDTSAGKDVQGNLLSIMFELIEVRPSPVPFDFVWGTNTAVSIRTPTSLKTLVKEVTKYDHDAYRDFWRLGACQQFLEDLAARGDVSWTSRAGTLNAQAFAEHYAQYSKKASDDLVKSGIVRSWFQCYKSFSSSEEHAVILNSFGVDTRKVVLATVPDECKVMQISVNYELWDERDVKKFESQFPVVRPSGADAAPRRDGDGAAEEAPAPPPEGVLHRLWPGLLFQ